MCTITQRSTTGQYSPTVYCVKACMSLCNTTQLRPSNRGLKVLDAYLKDLLKKGMNQATDVILTGCSGLESQLHVVKF